MIRRQSFRLEDLVVEAPAPPPDDPPLGVGEKCRVISGSPDLLVVDCDDVHVIVAWRRKCRTVEAMLSRVVVRRMPHAP